MGAKRITLFLQDLTRVLKKEAILFASLLAEALYTPPETTLGGTINVLSDTKQAMVYSGMK